MPEQTERAKFALIGGNALKLEVSAAPMRPVFLFDLLFKDRPVGEGRGLTFGMPLEEAERLHNALAIGLAAARGEEQLAMRLLSRSSMEAGFEALARLGEAA